MALSEIQCPNLAELAMDELLKIVSFGSFCSNYGLSFYECSQIMLQAPKVTFVLLSNFGNRSPFSDDYISYCEKKLAEVIEEIRLASTPTPPLVSVNFGFMLFISGSLVGHLIHRIYTYIKLRKDRLVVPHSSPEGQNSGVNPQSNDSEQSTSTV